MPANEATRALPPQPALRTREQATARTRRMLYGCAIVLAAFLLFLVQPLVAKHILPRYGGSASVWTVCMLFFQCALLAGYALAEWVSRRRNLALQSIAQTVTVGTALVVVLAAGLTVTPDLDAYAVAGLDEVAAILLLLAATVGLPFVALAVTSPLLQSWLARTDPGYDPYRLYALSNLGSLVALLGYPLWIEPAFGLPAQGRLWTVGFLVCAALLLLLAWILASHAARSTTRTDGDEVPAPAAPGVPPPTWREQGVWLLLAACGSLTMVGVTAHLTKDVASVPFLWILPLALYLLSFVICFGAKRRYPAGLMRAASLVAAVLMVFGMRYHIAAGPTIEAAPGPFLQSVALYGIGLLVLCVFFHGELADRKPDPRYLTRFYLMLSSGGAIGGFIAAVLAPLWFDDYWELLIALAVPSLFLLWSSRASWRVAAALSLACGTALATLHVYGLREQAVHMERNFYGVVRIIEQRADGGSTVRRLAHDGTLHGLEVLGLTEVPFPTTYYIPSSGVGLILADSEGDVAGPRRTAVIGLGTGTLASYGRTGDTFRFYEIDPAIQRVADTHFGFLQASPATIEHVLGDARLTLESESPNGFDLLVIDAFSGDSIPVHLITAEAIDLYRRHLSAQGTLAFHISNRHLDLTPVLRRQLLPEEQGWLVLDTGESYTFGSASTWVIFTRSPADSARIATSSNAHQLTPDPQAPLWNDRYSSLLTVLKGHNLW